MVRLGVVSSSCISIKNIFLQVKFRALKHKAKIENIQKSFPREKARCAYMICNSELYKATLNWYAHFGLHSHVLHIKKPQLCLAERVP